MWHLCGHHNEGRHRKYIPTHQSCGSPTAGTPTRVWNKPFTPGNHTGIRNSRAHPGKLSVRMGTHGMAAFCNTRTPPCALQSARAEPRGPICASPSRLHARRSLARSRARSRTRSVACTRWLVRWLARSLTMQSSPIIFSKRVLKVLIFSTSPQSPSSFSLE